MTTTLTDDQVLDEIRGQLAAMKVPGAEEATMDQQWAKLERVVQVSQEVWQ